MRPHTNNNVYVVVIGFYHVMYNQTIIIVIKVRDYTFPVHLFIR